VTINLCLGRRSGLKADCEGPSTLNLVISANPALWDQAGAFPQIEVVIPNISGGQPHAAHSTHHLDIPDSMQTNPLSSTRGKWRARPELG